MKFTQFVRDYLANNKDSGLTYREAMKDDGVRCAYKQYEADLCKKGIIREPEKRPEPKRRYNKKSECGDNVINQTINTQPQFSPGQPQAHPSPPPQVGFQGPPPKAPRGSYAPSVIDQMAASPYYQQNPLIFEEAKKNVLAAMEQAKAQPKRPAVRPPVRVDVGSEFGDDSTIVSELPDEEYALRPPLPRRPARVQMDDDYSTVVSTQPDEDSVAASYPGSDSLSVVQGPPADETDPFEEQYHADGGFGPGSVQIPTVEDFPPSYQAEAKDILESEVKLKEALDDELNELTEEQLNDLYKKAQETPPPTPPKPRRQYRERSTGIDLRNKPETPLEQRRYIRNTEEPRKPLPLMSEGVFDQELNDKEKAVKEKAKMIKQLKKLKKGYDRSLVNFAPAEVSLALPTAEERKKALTTYPFSEDIIDETRADLSNLIRDSQIRKQGQNVQNRVLDIMENEISSIWGMAFDEAKDEIGQLISALVDESVDEVTKEEASKKLSEEIDNLEPTIEAKDIAKQVAEEILGGVGGVIDTMEANKKRDEELAELHKKKWGRIQKSTAKEDAAVRKQVDKEIIGNDLVKLTEILTNPDMVQQWMSDPQSKKDLERAITWVKVSEDVEQDIVDEFLREIITELAGANNRYVKKLRQKIDKKLSRRKPVGRYRGKVQMVKDLPPKAGRRVGKLQRKQDTFAPFPQPLEMMEVEGTGLEGKKQRMKDLLSAIIDLV